MAKKIKDSQFLLKINREDKYEFIDLCDELDISASSQVRSMIKNFVKENKNGSNKT